MPDWGKDEEETMLRPISPSPGQNADEEQTIVRRLPEEVDEKTSLISRSGAGAQADETMVISVLPSHLGYLIETTGLRAGHVHRLPRETVIGRDAGPGSILVDDQTVTKAHAKVRLENDHFVLYDLASTNGTWLRREGNKERVQNPTPLTEGDVIHVGRQSFIFMEVTAE